MDEKFFADLTEKISPSEVISLSESESIAFYENADPDDAGALAAAAESEGYSVVRDEKLAKFRAVTLSGADGTALHVTYDSEERLIRALRLPSIPELADAAGGDAVCDPLIIQADMGLGIPKLDEGMCYILRARDGSFVVIDSGYRKGVCAMHIYDLLKKYSPDGNINVRAWFFTHAHGDHAGGFFEFAEMYHAFPDIKIERFYFGFIENGGYSVNFDNTLAPRVRECVARYYPSARVERPLSGVTYNFSGLGVTVFFALEDFLPRRIANEPDATPASPLKGDGNNLSTVLRVKEGDAGASFLALADTTRVCCDAMCERYGALLESDFVQAAHHGLAPRADGPAYQPRRNNGTEKIYSLIKPRTAFFPCSAAAAERRLEYDVNRYLTSITEKTFIADADTVLTFERAKSESAAK